MTDYTLANLTQPAGPRRRRIWLVVSLITGAVLLVGATAAVTWFATRPTSTAAVTAGTASASPSPAWSSVFGGASTANAWPTPPASYANADDLLDWLAKEGLGCTDTVEHVDSPLIATSLIDCGDDLSVAVYASHKDAVRGLAALNVAGMHAYVALGSNWTVNGDDAYVRLVAQRLNGEYHEA